MSASVQLSTIPGGVAGTRVTLRAMADAVRASLTNPDARRVAVAIVRACPGHDYGCQLGALRAWLRARFRFVRDPRRVELVHAPHVQLDTIAARGVMHGDCDDAAVLAAALGELVGFPARFVVLGFLGHRGPFSHVYTELQAGGKWYEFDVTRRGSKPPLNPTRVAVYPVE